MERGGLEKESFDLNVEGSSVVPREEALNSMTEKKDEFDCAVEKECCFDLNESPGGNADLTEDVNDKGRSSRGGRGSVREADVEPEVDKNEANEKGCCSGGGSVKKIDVETEMNKNECSNDTVLIGGRVLRSRSKRGDDNEYCKGENSGALHGESNESGVLGRIEFTKEYDEVDEYVSDGHENEKDKLTRKRASEEFEKEAWQTSQNKVFRIYLCDGTGSSGSDLIIVVAVPPSNACQVNESGYHPLRDHSMSQLNKCCVTYEEKQCIDLSHISIQAAEGHYVRPIKSEDYADSIHHDSHKMSDNCELKSKNNCIHQYFTGSEVQTKIVNGCASHCRPDINNDCAASEAILIKDVTKNITEDTPATNCGKCSSMRNEVPSVVEVNSLHADKNIGPDNKPGIAGSSKLSESDLQLDQTAQSNLPSLCSPNTASDMCPHWASGSST
ncbi:unnamed protein product [Lupinus luteus]|uniref:Uncharacterized protein n=1 Tax=Lupinus luteus TaxID=3873 RepID=A0AAV1X5F0_LUPLU